MTRLAAMDVRELVANLMDGRALCPPRTRAAIIALDTLLELGADITLTRFDTGDQHGPDAEYGIDGFEVLKTL